MLSAEGNFDLLPPGEPARAGGSWISIGQVLGGRDRTGGGILVDLEPSASVTVPVSITVPSDATPGDQPAGIVAEVARTDGATVQLATRVGVRVHLRVAGDVVASVAPEQVSTTWTPSWNPFAPGTVTVEYQLENAGNVRLGADSEIAVAGPFGLAPARADDAVREILPGQDASARIEMSVWPLLLGWGEVSVTPLTVGEDDVTAPAPVRTSFMVWTVPWSQLALAAAAVGVFFLVHAARRRSRARVQAQIDAAVAAAQRAETDVTPSESPRSSPAQPIAG